MKRLLGVTPLIALALVPSAADAGTLTASPSCGSPAPGFFCRTTFTYVAEPGEANRVTAAIGLGSLQFSDAGAAKLDYPATLCSPVRDGIISCRSGGEDPQSEVLLLVDAGDGDDEVSAQQGITVSPGSGNDTIRHAGVSYESASAPVDVDLTARRATSGDETDTFVDVHVVHGSRFADSLTGSAAADRLYGGPGRDRISGSGGDDVVDGGLGVDRLSGGAGDDEIAPGDPGETPAADRLTCGRGVDTLQAEAIDLNESDPIDVVDASCERASIFARTLEVRPRIANGKLTVRDLGGRCDCAGDLTVRDVATGLVIARGPAKRRTLKISRAGEKVLDRRGTRMIRFTWTGADGTTSGYTLKL
jgi:hypothetical protein